MNKKVYLDSASTTYIRSEVLQEMLPVLSSNFGNANSNHHFGREALSLMDKARDRVSNLINSKPTEIFFTSGGTESNNWAIRGLAYANKESGNHIITTKIEHSSSRETFKQLESEGFKVTYLNVDEDGLINFPELIRNLNSDTILVSVIAANNEIGTIQHINAIASTVKNYNAIFHLDAVQAINDINFDVYQMQIDAMTISSHKLYGPKGAGCLFLKKGTKIKNLVYGGTQEYARRPGTVNVPAIVGFGKAVDIINRDRVYINKTLNSLKEYFISKLNENIENIKINGAKNQSVNHIISCTIKNIDADALTMLLDNEGIAVSKGSACSVGIIEPSYVLKAIGLNPKEANSTIRISLTHFITKEDIDFVVSKIKTFTNDLRKK